MTALPTMESGELCSFSQCCMADSRVSRAFKKFLAECCYAAQLYACLENGQRPGNLA